MLTIFANIRINDEDSLRHLMDSFSSFKSISNDWLINIRGSLRIAALEFLKKELNEKGTFFELLEDRKGWAVNSLQMIDLAKYPYILVWNEDHLNLAPQGLYEGIVRNMVQANADYLPYSWWFGGKLRGEFDQLPLEKYSSIDVVYLTTEKWAKVRSLGYPYFIIGLTGIFRKDFLKMLLLKDRHRTSIFDLKYFYKIAGGMLAFFGIRSGREVWFNRINKYLFRKKLRRFSKETPFDLEYEPDRTDVLPFTLALPRRELFACIDDDNGQEGYQLIKRGLYPLSNLITLAEKMSDDKDSGAVAVMAKGESIHKQYHQNVARTKELIKDIIQLVEGKVEIVAGGKEKRTISAGEAVEVYPNVGYIVVALESSKLVFQHPAYYAEPQDLHEGH